MPHPMVNQLRFTRSEFLRAIKRVSEEEARLRLLPMNCISWNVGHLAWQEQRYFLRFGQDQILLPELDEQFAYGAPASTPSLKDMLAAWKMITLAVDPWLDKLTSAKLQKKAVNRGKPIDARYGNLLQRVIYHYWYHLGENMAIRQQLGHSRLPEFVGNIDDLAPYQPDNL